MFQICGDMWGCGGGGRVWTGELFFLLASLLVTLGAPLGIEDLVKCNPLISIVIIIKFAMFPS